MKKICNMMKKVLMSPLFYILVFSFFVQKEIYKLFPTFSKYPDSATYIEGFNYNIFKGEVDSIRTPIYPYFCKIIEKIGGSGNLYANIVLAQKILFFISIVIVFYILKKLTKNKLLIILGTLVYGILPSLFMWNTTLLTESLSIVEIVTLIYVTISYIKKPSYWSSVLIGIQLLILIMTRPATLYLILAYCFYWLLKFILDRKTKEIKYIKSGIITMLFVILLILLYCGFVNRQYHRFGLSAVSNLNNSLILIDSGLYKYSSNKGIIDEIDYSLNSDHYVDAWSVYHDLIENHSNKEIDEFIADTIKNSKNQYILFMISKSLKIGESNIGAIYPSTLNNKNNINYLSKQIFPINFSIAYIFILIGFIYEIYYIIKNKNIEWISIFLTVVIAGNIFTSIVFAPFETQRLCVTSIPTLIFLIIYFINIMYYREGKLVKKMDKKNNKLLYKIFVEETKDTKLQFFRYIFVGGFAAVVNIASLMLFKEVFGLYYLVANVLGFTLGLITNYILSKILVFAKENANNKIFEFITYAIIGVIGLGFDTLFMWIFTDLLGLYYLLSKIISTGLVFIWNFLARKGLYIFIDKFNGGSKNGK